MTSDIIRRHLSLVVLGLPGVFSLDTRRYFEVFTPTGLEFREQTVDLPNTEHASTKGHGSRPGAHPPGSLVCCRRRTKRM